MSDRIRVCHVINSLGHGGAERLLVELTRKNIGANTDFDMTVCSIEENDPLASELGEIGVKVQNFGASFKFDPRSILKMYRFFRQESFDIVHAHLPLAHSLGRMVGRVAGTKLIVSTQHNVADNYHPITRILEKSTRPLDVRTVAVSKGVRQSFSTPVFWADHWDVIYNGINVDDYNRSVRTADTGQIKDQWGITDDIVLLNVARHDPEKSQIDLIDAMPRVLKAEPNTKLLIVGDGELRGELEKRISGKGLSDSVELTGHVPSVTEYYAIADCFVSSSTREGLPITLLEAMASELPVVATAIPGVDELVVEGETGFLVPPKSSIDLADRILELSDPIRRREFGRAGFKRVRGNFDISNTLEKHLQLYREILDEAIDTNGYI